MIQLSGLMTIYGPLYKSIAIKLAQFHFIIQNTIYRSYHATVGSDK